MKEIKLCKADNCDRKPVSTEYCLMHYKRFKKHGDANYQRIFNHEKTCEVKNCDELVYCKDLCNEHYHRMDNHGDPLGGPQGNKFKRFENKFDKFFSLFEKGPKDECWEWQGNLHTKMPYGKFQYMGKDYLAHRVCYEFYHGPIPQGMFVMHFVCDNPRCVNPSHLKLGTHLENMQDCAKKGRTAIKKGQSNPYVIPKFGEENINSKITNKQRDEIINRFKQGESTSKLMKEYNLSKTHIYRYRRQALGVES